MGDRDQRQPADTQQPYLPFMVGGGVADITPPLEVGLLMSSVERQWAPFESVRMPLHARALFIGNGRRRIAVVSLELLGLTEAGTGSMEQFRRRIIAASGGTVTPDELVLISIHTHTAPETLALSDLHRTPAYARWLERLCEGIGAAVRAAAQKARPCAAAFGRSMAEDLAIHRRIRTTRGILLSHPEPPREIVLSREGPVDHSVHVAAFLDEGGRPRGILVNASCHPVHEMCLPHVSPDYPGIMSAELERRYAGSTVLFLNGAAGNVNPPTVSEGPAAAERHGLRLAGEVDSLLQRLQPHDESALSMLWEQVWLPSRSSVGNVVAGRIHAKVGALRVAEAAFVFLPGEPFAETGLAIRERSRFGFTAVVGYSEASVGYIPTDEAFREGGYETGPGGWSHLAPGSEGIIRRTASDLLDRLWLQEAGDASSAG